MSSWVDLASPATLALVTIAYMVLAEMAPRATTPLTLGYALFVVLLLALDRRPSHDR